MSVWEMLGLDAVGVSLIAFVVVWLSDRHDRW